MEMNWAWIMGMMILSVVPAIVGGGLFWHIFEKWTAVIIWQVVLLCIMSFLIAKGDRARHEAH
jgi:purine-cytosine permease-like protein